MSYRITVRRGPKVEHERADTLDEAIEVAERYVRGSRRRESGRGDRPALRGEHQVAVRIELKGPGGRGGLDVRGDGGVIAWTAGCSARSSRAMIPTRRWLTG